MEKFQITEYSQTVAALALLREKYARPFDASTTKGMEEAREARATLRSYRTSLEATRKEIKAPALDRCRLIDDEARQINNELVALENPIDAVIKAAEKRKAEERAAKERAERERVTHIQAALDSIRQAPVRAVGKCAVELRESIAKLDEVKPDPAQFLEFLPDALTVIAEARAALVTMLKDRERIEAEQQRLAEQRAELERQQRAEQERINEENQRIAAQRAEIDRQQRQIAAREEADRRHKAEEKRQAEEAARQHQVEEARKAEETRKAEEAERIARETREREDQELEEWQRIDPIMHLAIAIQYKRLTIEEALKAAYQMGVESVAQTEHAA